LREIYQESEARNREQVFKRDEVVQIKGCFFKVENIIPEHNKLVLVGISKEEGLKAASESIREKLLNSGEANVF
jgi:hypothetical protein